MMPSTLDTMLRVGAAALCLAAKLPAAAAETDAAQSFPVARARFEQNATDGDVEVVFEVIARAEGLTKLSIVSPDGRTIVDFQAPDASTLGIRQFVFESPEPKDIDRVKSAYPEGEYLFSGTTATGRMFRGTSQLNHSLPTSTTLIAPLPEARDLPVQSMRIAWQPVRQVAAYVVVLEEQGSPTALQSRLPDSATHFDVPAGFLRADTEYGLGIGVVGQNGNISFVETSFRTAAPK
jgi:hypothetical protein